MLITVSLQSTTMRYNGQLHRTPRYSRVPARDDHGAPRCVGRDGRMRPTVQRALGASDAAAARPARTHASPATRVAPYVRHARRRRSVLRMEGARHGALARRRDRCAVDAARHARTHASHATRVAFLRTACASQAVHSSDGRRAALMPVRVGATDAPSILYDTRRRMRRVRRASLRPYGMRVARGPFFGRRACGTREPSCPRTATSDGDLRSMPRSAARYARVMPPNGDLRRRLPFHAARHARHLQHARLQTTKNSVFCYYFSSRSKIVIFILEFSLQNTVIS